MTKLIFVAHVQNKFENKLRRFEDTRIHLGFSDLVLESISTVPFVFIFDDHYFFEDILCAVLRYRFVGTSFGSVVFIGIVKIDKFVTIFSIVHAIQRLTTLKVCGTNGVWFFRTSKISCKQLSNACLVRFSCNF